jgi:tetratricopeptide (TPR) repeat protein
MKQGIVSLFILTVVLMGCTTEAERTQMRAALDSINQLNRSDQPFTAKDVESYVRFFDRHGSPNDRLLTHYLLGRAYHEQGEAPMALHCYHDALDCADTTAQDCDYAQLARVYAQMAEIFYYQGLYRQQLELEKQSVKYAWLAKDTLAALMNYEQESFAYTNLGMPDSAILVIEDVSSRYEKYGYSSYAAIALGTIIRPLINRGEYRKAKDCIDRYESKSGLFNVHGDIARGREIYYNLKGTYYLHTGMPDSAEYYFRKELYAGKDFNNQNAAAQDLAKLYQKQHQKDSAAKYALYAYAMSDSLYAQRNTKDVERIQAMYDYTRYQKETFREKEKTYRRTIIIWICIAVIIIVCLVAYTIFRELSRKRKETELKYTQSLMAIAQAQHDIDSLRLSEDINKKLISEKEQIIREQETIMKSLLQRDSNSQTIADRKLKDADIYFKFEQLAFKGLHPSHGDWEQMAQHLFLCYPGFKDFLSKHATLINDKEYKTCLLIRMGYKPTNIGAMLEVSSSYITELRTRMLLKLYGISGSSKMFDKMLRDIY